MIRKLEKLEKVRAKWYRFFLENCLENGNFTSYGLCTRHSSIISTYPAKFEKQEARKGFRGTHGNNKVSMGIKEFQKYLTLVTENGAELEHELIAKRHFQRALHNNANKVT